MSGFLKQVLPWTLVALVIAVAVHLVLVYRIPGFVMARALSRMGAVNTIHHARRADATSRGVVRPSPDLLYSACPFDVSKRPLHITADVPDGTYWSVSLFDDETNNFFVMNDRQARDHRIDIVLMQQAPLDTPLPKGAEIVRAPDAKGVVLFRTLINNEQRLSVLDAERRKANCAPL